MLTLWKFEIKFYQVFCWFQQYSATEYLPKNNKVSMI